MANFLVFEENPTPGTLTVQTKINGNKCFSYVFDAEKFARQAFRVDNGTSVRYEFTPKAATGGGNISGTMPDFAGATVDLYVQSASLLKASTIPGYVWLTSVVADADGNYSFTHLPPGVYILVVWDKDGNYLFTSPQVTVNVGESTCKIDFPLPFEGSGTIEDPFQIGTAAKLREFAGLLNAGATHLAWCFNYFKLTADINLNNELWTPIGILRGHFDGNGHKITGLYVNSSGYGVGLFGNVVYGATVQNLGVEGTVISTDAAGGISGILNAGNIINCYSNVSVTAVVAAGGVVGSINIGSTVRNCYATGAVYCSGAAYGVGGVAGWVGDTSPIIIDCAALNPSVTAPAAPYNEIGRVSGGSSYSVVNCVSYLGIAMPEVTHGDNGTGWTKEQIQADGTLGGRFTSPVWTTENGKLPGFGAAVALPEHLR